MLVEYQGKRPTVSPKAFIAPTAVLIGDVRVGDDSSVWWGAVLRADMGGYPILVGARTSIQDNCVIHSGEQTTIVGDECTIGHGAIMEGCDIKRGVIVGMNCTILEDTEIGEGSLIAAGSVVVPHTKIPAHVLAAGSPAQVKKEIAGDARKWIDMAPSAYVGLTQSYLGGNYKVIG